MREIDGLVHPDGDSVQLTGRTLRTGFLVFGFLVYSPSESVASLVDFTERKVFCEDLVVRKVGTHGRIRATLTGPIGVSLLHVGTEELKSLLAG